MFNNVSTSEQLHLRHHGDVTPEQRRDYRRIRGDQSGSQARGLELQIIADKHAHHKYSVIINNGLEFQGKDG